MRRFLLVAVAACGLVSAGAAESHAGLFPLFPGLWGCGYGNCGGYGGYAGCGAYGAYPMDCGCQSMCGSCDPCGSGSYGLLGRRMRLRDRQCRPGLSRRCERQGCCGGGGGCGMASVMPGPTMMSPSMGCSSCGGAPGMLSPSMMGPPMMSPMPSSPSVPLPPAGGTSYIVPGSMMPLPAMPMQGAMLPGCSSCEAGMSPGQATAMYPHMQPMVSALPVYGNPYGNPYGVPQTAGLSDGVPLLGSARLIPEGSPTPVVPQPTSEPAASSSEWQTIRSGASEIPQHTSSTDRLSRYRTLEGVSLPRMLVRGRTPEAFDVVTVSAVAPQVGQE